MCEEALNHSQQIVLYRQNLRLCNKFSKLSIRIRVNSQIYSIRKASSNGFAYVWEGLKTQNKRAKIVRAKENLKLSHGGSSYRM